MDPGVSGRTALITGAARAIGLADAEALAADGAAVAINDIDAQAINASVDVLRAPRHHRGGLPPPKSAAEADVVGLTRTMAKELGRPGITADAIAPGCVETALTNHSSDARRTIIAGQNPVLLYCKVEEIGAPGCCLCSTQTAFINGERVSIDGGRTITTGPATDVPNAGTPAPPAFFCFSCGSGRH